MRGPRLFSVRGLPFVSARDERPVDRTIHDELGLVPLLGAVARDVGTRNLSMPERMRVDISDSLLDGAVFWPVRRRRPGTILQGPGMKYNCSRLQ